MFVPSNPEFPGDERNTAHHTTGDDTPDASTPVPVSSPPSDSYDAQRRRVLALAAGGAGAMLLAAAARPAQAGSMLFDLRNERTALRVVEELLEMSKDFFGRANRFDMTRPNGRLANIFNLVLGQDRQVYDLIRMTVVRFGAGASGGSGGPFHYPNAHTSGQPMIFSFPQEIFTSGARAAVFGGMLKDTMVGALHGALPFIEDHELLGTLAAAAGVQGRHAALLREVSGANPFPEAFESALTLDEVKERLAPYGYTGGAPKV